MKLLVDIPDQRASFAMEVLRSLSFIRMATPLVGEKVKLWEGLADSVQEVRLHRQGKLKLQSAQDLLHEL
ncbi:hypothetical protein AGMMS49938_10510 [Fibrobacterales bacterium]|nr:hypothetical protein AGMMS49938_10510 [Fibrobacterales bacterium]